MFGKKEKDISSPTSSDNDNPLANFLILISVIITTPFVFLYSLLTGKIKNSFLIVLFLLLVIVGFYYVSLNSGISKRDIKTKIIQQTLEEITEEEKEEMREEISTIRKEVDINKIPPALLPIVDVPIDMLSINYLMFMIQSGYIQPNGEGAEFILDSYLHSKHKPLQEKSWEALQNIKSEAAYRVIRNYEAEIEKKNELLKLQYESEMLMEQEMGGSKGHLFDGLRNKLDSLRNR